MKKILVFTMLCCFLTTITFAQTEEIISEELKVSMEQLKEDMEQLRQDLKDNLENMEVDLSGLDALKEIDWENISDNEGIAYLESDEFNREMANVKDEVNKAMEEVRREMAEIEKINWEEINGTIEEAMKELDEELSNLRKQE